MAFFEKMKEFMDKSVSASKSAFDKAGDAVQNFGDKSVTKIELKKLETQLEKKYAQIGKFAYEFFMNKKTASLKADNADFEQYFKEAQEVVAELDKKKAALGVSSSEEEKKSEKTEKTPKSTKTGNKTAKAESKAAGSENKETEN
ncbi:MAG: hypothetical protein K6G52_08580 [Treponemataceae bacterium]|nr:hypothetical protein [Treponemataceae bacterium]